MYDKVKEQHEHFNIRYKGRPRHLEEEEKKFYHEAFIEEAGEYLEAETLEDEYDAILDLLVFTIGAMLRHGFKPEGIEEVVRANLDKEVGPISGKRNGFHLDLRKPEGWTPPDLRPFL